MSITEDTQKVRMAYEQGAAARRGGKPVSTAPYKGNALMTTECRESFGRGWDYEDARIKRQADARKAR